MIYQAKSTEFGEFCIIFFHKLKFGQILSGNSNFGRPKSTEIPEFRPFRSGPVKIQNRNPNPWLPVRRQPRSPDEELRFQANHYINISYLAYAPILFQAAIVSSTYSFSRVSE
jgi:hypothetical protein